jgi:nucleoside phosphorylase
VSAHLATAAREGTPIQRVVFVGTAGAYDTQTYPLHVVRRVRRAVFTDGGAARGDAYFPAPAQAHAPPESGAKTLDSPLRAAADVLACVCPPSITLAAGLAEAFARYGALENLELAGLARACAETRVPWEAFLGVSNAVGATSHEEWKQHHAAASLAAQRALFEAYDSSS